MILIIGLIIAISVGAVVFMIQHGLFDTLMATLDKRFGNLLVGLVE